MKKMLTALSALLVLGSAAPALASFKRTVPQNATELQELLVTIRKHKAHITRAKVNLTTAHIEIDLDAKTNAAGVADVFIPLKRAKLNDAPTLLDKILQAPDGNAPASADVSALYDMIDPSAQ